MFLKSSQISQVLKHLCWSLFLIKRHTWRPVTLLKRDSSTGVFLWNLCEIFKNTFFYRTPLVAASGNSEEVIKTDCHLLCCFCQPVIRNQAFSNFKQVRELRQEQCNQCIRHNWHKDRSLIIQNLVSTLKRLVGGASNWTPPLWFFRKFIF